MDIYISTLAFLGKTIEEIISNGKEEKFQLEFSSGLQFKADILDYYYGYPYKKLPHNYFPAPEDPFVLNLASGNEGIRKRSIEHCIQGLHIAKNSGGMFFSAHAGFCIDPNPRELGQKLSVNKIDKRESFWENFINSVTEILTVAEVLGITFLIENNVLAKMNVTEEGINPLLCCDPEEISSLSNFFPSKYFGILLDTAHLKVSSNTLKFNCQDAVAKVSSSIKIIHHSDNDGILDANDPFNENYWFLPFIPNFKNVIHVLEVKNLSNREIFEHINILKKHI